MEGATDAQAGEAAGWENTAALSLTEREETAVLCRLFADLLEFYDLEYSLSVFRNEVNEKPERDFNAALRSFGIDPTEKSKPLIFQLLEPLHPVERREEPKPATTIVSKPPRPQTVVEPPDEDDENDIFLKESYAMDLSVESRVDEQFDYAEDAELIL